MSPVPRVSKQNGTQRHPARSWGLPLLMKDLHEQSHRRRTYLVRFIYACGLVLTCSVVLNAALSKYSNIEVLGAGADVFVTLTKLQTFGLYLVLPLLACSTLTAEKERNTLDLLLLTKLGPGTIILEKFLSRLIPALNLLLISAPILALGYSLGGISLDQIVFAFLGLILSAIRLTAVGVMCSAGFPTTIRALVGTYVATLLLSILESIVFGIVVLFFFLAVGKSTPVMADAGNAIVARSIFGALIAQTQGTKETWLSIVLNMSLLIPISIGISSIMLILARRLLIATSVGELRTFTLPPVPTQQPVQSQTAPSESFESDGPDFDPIRWREGLRCHGMTDRNAYLIYVIGMSTFVSMITICALLVLSPSVPPAKPYTAATTITVWLILTIWLCNKGSRSVTLERSQQTLDILLVTPLRGAEIVNQKMAGVNRIIMLGRLALTICVLYQFCYRPQIDYLLASALMLWLYPPLIGWQAMLCGMETRNGSWAIWKSFLMVTLRCVVPIVVCYPIGALFFLGGPSPMTEAILLTFAGTSPLTLLFMSEYSTHGTTPIEVVCWVAIGTGISSGTQLWILRQKAVLHADENLGRIVSQGQHSELGLV